MAFLLAASSWHTSPTPCCHPHTLARQWYRAVVRSQGTLGALYSRIYDTIRARGVPPEGESVLWACLARLKDPKTGAQDSQEAYQDAWRWEGPPARPWKGLAAAARG